MLPSLQNQFDKQFSETSTYRSNQTGLFPGAIKIPSKIIIRRGYIRFTTTHIHQTNNPLPPSLCCGALRHPYRPIRCCNHRGGPPRCIGSPQWGGYYRGEEQNPAHQPQPPPCSFSSADCYKPTLSAPVGVGRGELLRLQQGLGSEDDRKGGGGVVACR